MFYGEVCGIINLHQVVDGKLADEARRDLQLKRVAKLVKKQRETEWRVQTGVPGDEKFPAVATWPG